MNMLMKPRNIRTLVLSMSLSIVTHSSWTYTRHYSLRHANFGKMAEYLTNKGVPNFLQKSFDDCYLHDRIRLRLLPTTHPYFPELVGKTKYKASINAIRLLTNKLILAKRSQLRITSVIALLKDDEESLAKRRQYNCCTNNDKLVVKWQSCSSKEECARPVNNNAGIVTPFPGMKDSKSPFLDFVLNPSSERFSGDDVKAHVGSLNRYESRDGSTSRIVKGIFIFEFNDDNSQILVHTIEEVEMIDFEKKIPTGALAC